MKNRFEAVGDIEDPEEEHDKILETYREAAKKVIGWSKHGEKLRRGKRQTLKQNARWKAFKTEEKARIQCEKQQSKTKC